MNILVIATHHGCLLTLGQLRRRIMNAVLVVVPRSQIEKYSKMEGKCFTEYLENVRKVAGPETLVYVSEDWNPANKLKAAYDFLHTLGMEGQWLVVESGTLLGDNIDEKEPQIKETFGVVKNRVHPKFKRLYKMLGLPEEDKVVYSHSFFVNMSNQEGKLQYLDSDLFMRPDPLYAESLGPLWCIRYHQMTKECIAMNFWMEVIRAKQTDGEWISYPYDQYLTFTRHLWDYLPKKTFDNISTNGSNTDWLFDLVQLDL